MSEDRPNDASLVKLLEHLSAVTSATTMVKGMIEDGGAPETTTRKVDRTLRALLAQEALNTLRKKLCDEDFEVLEQFFRRGLWDDCLLLCVQFRTRFVSLEILGQLVEEATLDPETRAAVGKAYHRTLDRALAYANEENALHLIHRLDELQTKSNQHS